MYYEEFDVEGEEQEVQENKDDESMDSFDREMAEQDRNNGAAPKKE